MVTVVSTPDSSLFKKFVNFSKFYIGYLIIAFHIFQLDYAAYAHPVVKWCFYFCVLLAEQIYFYSYTLYFLLFAFPVKLVLNFSFSLPWFDFLSSFFVPIICIVAHLNLFFTVARGIAKYELVYIFYLVNSCIALIYNLNRSAFELFWKIFNILLQSLLPFEYKFIWLDLFYIFYIFPFFFFYSWYILFGENTYERLKITKAFIKAMVLLCKRTIFK